MHRLVCLLAMGLALISAQVVTNSPAPRFTDYRVIETFTGFPAPPILATAEQKRFRTRISQGVTKGEGVWTGSWKNPARTSGPNFAGHYFVVRWGCGSNCLMMAVVDARTGKIDDPPLSGTGSELYVPMDIHGDLEVDFRLDSSLMILRNACKGAERECGVYYFNFKDDRFHLVRRVLVDPTNGLK